MSHMTGACRHQVTYFVLDDMQATTSQLYEPNGCRDHGIGAVNVLMQNLLQRKWATNKGN